MRLIFKAFFFFLFSCQLFAQKHTISGKITDASSGELLVGVNIYEKNKFIGTTSNTYGFYSLTLPEDSHIIVFSFVGYQTQEKVTHLDKDQILNITLSTTIDLEEVEIIADKIERIEEKTQMSSIKVPIKQIKAIPALFGEVDVLKALQLLPGVQSGGEGTSGLYVRGGGPDQNLILLDGVPVYNVSHLFGFFSVFNADAIKDIELIKGGFPARYGGRLSSVIDIRMKEGNMKKVSGEGAIGLVASKFSIEGPIVKDKTSFIISARRTYIDLLAQPIIRNVIKSEGGKGTLGYYFYDLNGKINHKLSDKDHLFFSYYMGDDRAYAKTKNDYINSNVSYEIDNNFNLKWGNIIGATRWNHVINKKLFSNVTLTYSQYRFSVEEEFVQTQNDLLTNVSNSTRFAFKNFSGINDWAGKVDFDFIPSPNHYIKFGANHIYHTFSPGATSFKQTSNGTDNIDTTLGNAKLYANEFSTYIEDDFKINNSIKVNAGVHFSGFFVGNTFYNAVQPRISANYLFMRGWSVKASYADMTQYIHLLTNTGIGLPTDLWVPATENVKPQQSRQTALGLAHTFLEAYEISLEGYYKTMNNLIEYKPGASFLAANETWEDKVETEGKGWSYGMEFFVQKKSGNTTGWVGYTLSWTNRQFTNLNFGEKYPYRYDRRHDVSITISHKVNEKIDLAGTWVFGTGNAVTLPIASYEAYVNNDYYSNSVEYYQGQNGFRMAPYHRLDFGINFHKEKKWGQRTWNISVYNLYSRQNPFFLYFGYNNNSQKVLKQVSLFPIIPSVSYSFKF